MTQEYILRAFLHVAEHRGLTHSMLFSRLRIKPLDFARYKSGDRLFAFNTFYSWCATLEISPFYLFSVALMFYEMQAGVTVRMELMPTADRQGTADYPGNLPTEGS